MSYNITAIPTEYRGIRFRSRLEARWACFFDACGWRWDYEPSDFNGYIPDFRIGHTYLEVKPAAEYDEAAAYKAIRAVPFGPDCAEAHQFILLRDCPKTPGVGLGFAREIGWSLAPEALGGSPGERCHEDNAQRVFVVQAETWDATGPAVRHYRAVYDDMTSGRLEPLLPNTVFNDGSGIDRLWAQASNKSQWKASA